MVLARLVSHWCLSSTRDASAKPRPSTDSCKDYAKLIDFRHCLVEITAIAQEEF